MYTHRSNAKRDFRIQEILKDKSLKTQFRKFNLKTMLTLPYIGKNKIKQLQKFKHANYLFMRFFKNICNKNF